MDLPSTKTIAKTIGLSPETKGKSPLLKKTPVYLTEHGEVELVLPKSPLPSIG